MGNIVWARREHDGIYWPGTINFVSNKSTEVTSINSKLHHHQNYWYLVQFFGYDPAYWTGDVLPYRLYRDYMFKNLLNHYEPYPQVKYQFLDAVNQADNADMNGKSHPGKSVNNSSYKPNRNYNYNSTSHSMQTGKSILFIFMSNCFDTDYSYHNWTPFTNNESTYNQYSSTSHTYPQYTSNNSYHIQSSGNNYCSCCIPSSSSATNSSSQFNNNYQLTQSGQKVYSVMIITTKNYSNPSFISYLFNSLSHCIHHPIIYIDDPPPLPITNYHHPTTSTISYLICLDHFDSHIRQTLDSTILNHLTVHNSNNNNYLFILLNAPSHDLVKHFHSTVIDQGRIIVVHYYYRFENDALLLCSGDHRTYEEIRSNLLRYICPKVKYIESPEDPNKQFSSSNTIQPDNPLINVKSEPVVEISQKNLTASSAIKHSKNLDRQKLLATHRRKLIKRKSKKRLSNNGLSSSKYRVQNILDTVPSSK